MLALSNGEASVSIDPSAGGRLTSLTIGGLELIRARQEDPILWGCYPMAPWAGRVRNGEFTYAGRRYRLPRLRPPHAIHGTVFLREWQVENSQHISTRLGDDWPFPGTARQSFSLEGNRLKLGLEVWTDEISFPCSIGWHPWFVRQLARGGALELEFGARRMYIRDDAGITIDQTVAPTSGPWDDCFTDITHAPRLRWPGAIELTLHSSASHWIVFDENADAICIEPQTAPPDALNIARRLVTKQAPLRAGFTLTWRILENPDHD